MCVWDESAIRTSPLLCGCKGVFDKRNQNFESEVSRSDLIFCFWIVFFLACMCLVFAERLSMAKVCSFFIVIYLYWYREHAGECMHTWVLVRMTTNAAGYKRVCSRAGRLKTCRVIICIVIHLCSYIHCSLIFRLFQLLGIALECYHMIKTLFNTASEYYIIIETFNIA